MHGKVHDGRRWHDRVSGARKAVAVQVGCARQGGMRGEARGATNWAQEDQAGNAHGNDGLAFNGAMADVWLQIEAGQCTIGHGVGSIG